LQNLELFALDENILQANNEEEWEFIGSLANCSKLQTLFFGLNRFAGRLPSSLVNLSTNLQWLQIQNKSISGVIPSDIGNLAGLELIDFGENLLIGVIHESIGIAAARPRFKLPLGTSTILHRKSFYPTYSFCRQQQL
jgi:Leucine-rich repeat (LRR) protein